MLYGGIGADNKPLNDAWVLDLEKPAWSLIYMAHSDLCPPQVLVQFLGLFVTKDTTFVGKLCLQQIMCAVLHTSCT